MFEPVNNQNNPGAFTCEREPCCQIATWVGGEPSRASDGLPQVENKRLAN